MKRWKKMDKFIAWVFAIVAFILGVTWAITTPTIEDAYFVNHDTGWIMKVSPSGEVAPVKRFRP